MWYVHGHFWRHFSPKDVFVGSFQSDPTEKEIMSDLFCAAARGDLERVQVLVEQGVDMEKTGFYGEGPLWAASRKGHLTVVRYLVEKGANMEKADDSGWTPLIISSCRGHLDVVSYLLEQGANRDKGDNIQRTPLHHAAKEGHLETAKLLMVCGADLNARDNHGHLPIDMGCLNNEEIRQAIRDEPRRRMDHGHKRATEKDRHPNAAASASSQEQSNKKPRLGKDDEVEEGEVVEEDQESE